MAQQHSNSNDEWFPTTSTPYSAPPGPGYGVPLQPHEPPPPFASSTNGAGTGSPPAGSLFMGLRTQMQEHAMSYVTQEAMHLTRSQGVSRFLSIDWLLEWLQPYFLVDGPTVLKRLQRSLQPRAQDFALHEPDLYGPTMVVLTSALLLRLCLAAGHVPLAAGNTALGTVLALCVGYWWGATALLFLTSYASDTRLPLPSMLCAVGYSMTALLIILPLAPIGGLLLYLALLTTGGLTACSLALTVKRATPDVKRGAPTAALSAGVHVLFLLYLKWRYLP